MQIVQYGEHDHGAGDVNSGRLFTPEVLRIAESIVQDTPGKDLTFRVFGVQLRQRLTDKGIVARALPSDDKLVAWLKREKAKKTSAKWEHAVQGGSEGMAESIRMRIQDRIKWFGESTSELIILPEHAEYTSYSVTRERTLIIF